MGYPRPGDYITAKCTRCNDVTGHVVMLVLEGSIAKVECKACGSVHKYRDVKADTSKKTTSSAIRHVKAGQNRENAIDVGTKRTFSTNTPKQTAIQRPSASKAESAWQDAMVRHAASLPVSYSMHTTFEVKTLIEHPKFGRGEILSITKPDKMEILFQDGVKILRCKTE